jgi:hypothetical protein
MASWDCDGDGFVGFRRGRDIAGCTVDKGVVKGVAGEIVQHNAAPVLCVCIIRVGHFHPTEGDARETVCACVQVTRVWFKLDLLENWGKV